MKIIIKNQKGYIFLITFAIIIIFSVLGIALMAITSSGLMKNKIRQDTVYATDLADKGTDYIVRDIQHYLENEIKEKNYNKYDFENLLTTTLNDRKYDCSDGMTIPGENESETKVCIEKVELVSADEQDRYKRLVTFKSTGTVNNKEKVTRAKVIIGTDAIPDQLKYSVSTNDGGDLYLHGGVEVQGDIKTDGNLIISEQATWMKNYEYLWEDSVPARVVRSSNSIMPKLIMNEDKHVYILNTGNKPSYNNHIDGSELNDSNMYEKISPIISNASAIISNEFFASPTLKVVTKEELPDDQVDVTQMIENQYDKTNNRFKTDYQFSYLDFNNNQSNYNKQTTIFVGTSNMKRNCLNRHCSKISGDLNINASNNEVDLRGTYYVTGNLSITNTKLYSDALIYVKGDVTIRDSELMGIDDDSTLIIFAEGNISISNISEFDDDPSTIKGFFYTKSNMILYGVGSNITIYGGLSSKRLILTALRGSTTENRRGYIIPSSVNTQEKLDSSGNPTASSRLKIIYDQDLISQYTEFKRDELEEFITQLNDPEIIERSNE